MEGGGQECPTSGVLWAEEVAMAPRPKKKQRSIDAIKRCDNEPHVVVAVAQLFWNDRKVCFTPRFHNTVFLAIAKYVSLLDSFGCPVSWLPVSGVPHDHWTAYGGL